MHITRKTNQELVVVDSTVWLSVALLAFAAFGAYITTVRNTRGGFISVAILLLFAFLFWRKEIVTFDAGRQQAEWNRRRAFKTAGGTIPFSEIKGIAIDSSTSNSRNNLTYRLSILTKDSPVPMSDVYAGNWSKYDKLRTQILEFLHIEADERSSPGLADEAAIRLLLQQGRKIEAIQRLRSCQPISLAEAKDRVDTIDEKMKAAR